MLKNVAGQRFFFQGIKASDGTAFTDTVSATVAKDGGNAAAITGTVTLVTGGSGLYRVDPSQADTNGDYLGFSMTGTGMIPVSANFDTRPHEKVNPLSYVGNNVNAQVTGMDTAVIKSATIDNNAITAAGIAADAIGASEFAQAAADKVWDTTVRAITDKAGFSLSAAGVSAIWTTTLTESYAAQGAAFTGAQALYEICQVATEFGIVGTTLTFRQRNGTTAAGTYTLNDATNPTDRTRAT